MKKAFLTIVTCAMATATMPIATPTMAQGTVGPISRVGSTCPSGYSQGSTVQKSKPNPNMCYPSSSSAPAVYVKNGPCAAGYKADFGYCTGAGGSASSSSASTTYIPPTYGKIVKANSYDRCPVGYWTDENARGNCVSPYKDKAPSSRLKKDGACAADEVDEWGVYCTSKLTTMTRSEAENTAVADVNIIWAPEGKSANQGGEYENTPGILGIFGPIGGSPASAAASSSGSDQGSNGAQCQASGNGAAQGAAVGGAVAGQAGAVIGGMIGGFGKKKKKSGC